MNYLNEIGAFSFSAESVGKGVMRAELQRALAESDYNQTPQDALQESSAQPNEQILFDLIKRYGIPRTIVHRKYDIGGHYTEGVLCLGCCDECVDGLQRWHDCKPIGEDIKEAERLGIVSREKSMDGDYMVVVSDEFRRFFDTSAWRDEDDEPVYDPSERYDQYDIL